MDFLALTLAGILTAGAPLILATLGETLTERAGVINLSLDGTILLAAMTAFPLTNARAKAATAAAVNKTDVKVS